MKRFYSFLLMLVALLPMAMSAQTSYDFKIDVDDAAGVTLEVDWQPVALVNGVNTITVTSEYPNVKLTENAGYKISVLHPDGYNLGVYDGACYIYPNQYTAGQTWTVKATKIVNDSQVVISIDNPSATTVRMAGVNEPLSLVAGDNVIDYCSAISNEITVEDYGQNLFSVTADGVNAPFDYDRYRINLAGVKRIDIKSEYPEGLTFKVKFTFVNPGTEEFLSGVRVDGQELAPEVYGSEFEVPAGKTVEFYSNTSNNYNVPYDGITVNGNSVYMYGSANFKVKQDTEVKINVTKLVTYKANVNIVGDPAGVQISTANGNFTPTANDFQVEFTEGRNYLSVRANAGYYIESFTQNGESLMGEYGPMSAQLNDLDDIQIVVKEKVKDQTMVFFLDVDPSTFNSSRFEDKEYNTYTVSQGYNVIRYAAADGEFGYFGTTQDYQYAKAGYHNGVQMETYYGSGFKFSAKDGDVVHVFFNDVPAISTVNFNVKAEGSFEVKRDIIAPVSPLSDDVKEYFDGTQIDIIPAADAKLLVKVNDAVVPAVDGKHSFNLNGNSNVVIEDDTQNALGIINAAAVNSGVYNLQGIQVGNTETLSNLPAGLYIVNGKKIVKK